jgi:hypothetical protein
MRVRRTVPQFTFSFSELFVNLISSVSTGFFWFLSVLSGIRHINQQKPAKTPVFTVSMHRAPAKSTTPIYTDHTDQKRAKKTGQRIALP